MTTTPAELSSQKHIPCPDCGRLLVPVKGKLPMHRRPARYTNNKTSIPLTGCDAPWCRAGRLKGGAG